MKDKLLQKLASNANKILLLNVFNLNLISTVSVTIKREATLCYTT